jgi:hypothetical protein
MKTMNPLVAVWGILVHGFVSVLALCTQAPQPSPGTPLISFLGPHARCLQKMFLDTVVQAWLPTSSAPADPVMQLARFLTALCNAPVPADHCRGCVQAATSKPHAVPGCSRPRVCVPAHKLSKRVQDVQHVLCLLDQLARRLEGQVVIAQYVCLSTHVPPSLRAEPFASSTAIVP